MGVSNLSPTAAQLSRRTRLWGADVPEQLLARADDTIG
jgi:hypothetical protein